MGWIPDDANPACIQILCHSSIGHHRLSHGRGTHGSEPIERTRAVVENTTARRGEAGIFYEPSRAGNRPPYRDQSANEALRAKNAMLQWQLGEISDAHRTLEKSSLAATREMQQQLAAVTEELKSERGVSGALVVEASALKQQLNKMTSARTTLENEFKSAEQRTKQQLNDLQLQLAALTVEMESERAVRDALARQGNTLTETVSALRRERSALNADLKSAHAAIDLGTSEIGRRQAEIVTLSNQVAALRADLKEFKAALAQARIREADQKENNDELGRRLNAALAGRVRELAKVSVRVLRSSAGRAR